MPDIGVPLFRIVAAEIIDPVAGLFQGGKLDSFLQPQRLDADH
jgi:hypothetical protein